MFLKRFTLSPPPTSTLTNNNSSLSKKVDYYTEIQHNFLPLFQQKYLTKEHGIKPLMMAWDIMQIPKSLIINILDRAVTLECIYQATKSLNTNPEAVSIINKSILILKEKNFIDIYNLEIIINQILNSNTKFDLIELLKLNTERLLSNCFYIGHHLSNSEYDTFGAKLAIHRIGNLSEYCFHTLDDLSLFSSSNKSSLK